MKRMYKIYTTFRLSVQQIAARTLALVAVGLCGLFTQNLQAQITVTASGGNMNANYTTLAAAIAAINAGTHSGTITVDVVAGHTETLAGRINLTATGTMANPITIQKSGAGANPLLTAYVGVNTPSSQERDGMFSLSGSDWVTIDGIDLQENPANNDVTTWMEYGYGLFKNSDTDGCQNNTIKNCTITLNRDNIAAGAGVWHPGSNGIVVLWCSATSNTGITPVAASGTNSFNKFYSNTVQNVQHGITFIGFAAPTPFTLADTGNDVGGTASSTGNTIINYGGGAGTTATSDAVFVNNQWNFNCSFNTINNNNGGGVNHPNVLYGIWSNASSTSASADFNNNNVTVKAAGTTQVVAAIRNELGSTPAGNTVNINNNTITGEYLTATSGTFYGIWNSATAANLNMNGNTVSNMSYGAAALTGSGVFYGIHNSVSNAAMIVNVRNNTVSNLSRTGTTGGTTIGIAFTVGTTGMNVTIKNNTVDNLSIDGTGATSTMYGIQSSTGTIVVDSNLVNNLRCLKTTGTSALYGLYNISSPVDENYNYNTISNLTHNGTGITYGIIANTATGVRTVSHNTIFNIVSGGTTVAGMSMSLSSPSIFKNKIYNISSTSTGAPTVSGIVVTSVSANGIADIYNNLIGEIKAPNANTSAATAPSVRGINITATTATSMFNVSYNTVLLNATSAGANFGTTGLWATTSTTSTTATLTLRNNIIVNLSTPAGTGRTSAYQRSSTALNNYSSNSNNNLYYAGTPGANNLIFFDGTNADQTLVDFKNRVSPADANSITENPTFLSVSGASTDFLHINPAVATQIESGGANVAGITTDFDGNIRAGNAGYMGAGATPDIGADEGDFVALDLSGPAITYTPVPNLCSFGNIALNAVSITDATGIPLAGNLIPRVYYRKNAGSWFSQPGTYVSGSATNSVWNFTIVVSDLGGLVVGDVVQYYVIAQDIVVPTNIASNPGGVVATDVNNVTTHPATPNETEAVNTLSGTYTVGTGGDFPTLTAAVNAYNISCLGGPVVFSLTDANYPSETFPITINYNDFAGATNTLTIRPAAGNGATITGSATALIKIDGADWVTLDGSNSGGTDRSLNLINTSTSTSAAVWVASTNAPGNGATNIVVKNLNIEGGIGTTTNVFGIASKASSALTTGAADNDNLTIQNNAVAKVYTGISVTGTTAATAYDNLLITGNTIGSADPTKYIANRGIEISYANSPVVSDNSISNIITSSTNAATGIDVGINIIGGSVVRNNIITVYNTNSGGWNAYGIHFSSGTATTNVLAANNFISDIKTVNYLPTSSFNAFGIRISGGTNLKIYNNSIHQFGDVTVIGSGAGMSSNIYISSSAATGLEIRNNILSNVQSFATAGSFVYNIFISFSGYSFASIDNNDYYGLSSANTTYRVGYSGGTILTTLPDWQGFTAQDANSISVQPNFSSNTDLHLTSTNNQCLDGAGAVLAAVTDDFDGDSRDPLRPDIGADEFTNPNVTLTVAETSGAADNDGAVCFLDQATLTAAGGVSYSWSSNDNTPSIVVSPPATTTYTVTITHSNSCVDILQSTVTVTPLPTEFNVTGGGAFCAPGAGVPVGLSGSETGVNYQLQRDGVDAGSPLAGTGAALDFGNQTLAGSYTVIATNASTTCSAPMLGSAEVIPNQTPASFSMTGGGAFCDPGPGVPVGLSGSETGVDYQLQLNNVNLGAAVAGTGFALDFGSQNAAGAYTVVATYVIGGCTADMSGSAVVVANSSPVLSETHVEPTTCFAANGSIDLTVSGGTAPFAYNWFTSNGNGLQQGQQDQSNLTVGSYFVTVTDNNTCSATLLATLIGPGGCNACPVIGNLATTPAGICAGDNITLTASNLVDMGTTYGITFKYFGAPSATPYIGGTVIGTVDNSGLDNNGTTATITTSLATGGVYYLYAILDQLPIDPACRPSASYVLTVLSIPSVNPVSNQTVCAGSNTAAVNFSGPIPGTTYSWTNDNTSIGLAAAGTGNIPAFAAINNGTAPVTATITVTPSVNDPVAGTVCTGDPVTFTITVNPVPTVNAVVNQTYCNGAAVPSVVFTSNVPGATFNWSRTSQAIGLVPTSGSGNVPAFTAANATNAPVTATFTATATYTNNGVPCTGPAIQFTITVNPTPTVSATPTSQTVCNGANTTQISLSGAVAGTVYNWTNNNTTIGLAANGTGNIPSFVAVNTGGAPVTATITITPTYTNNGVFCSGTPIAVTITVNPTAQVNQPANVNTCGGALTTVTFTTTTPGTTYTWTNTNTAIGLPASGTGNISFTAAIVATTTVGTITVTPNYTNNGVSCPGVARTFTILVDPLPTVNAVANQPAVCSGDATNAVTFTGSIPGTVFNWTNNNTNIGLAASGTGNIPSFIAQNPGTTIQTATITVTPVLVTGSGSCPGTPITFTYTVYPRPVVTLPASVVICQDQNAVLSATLGGGATGGTWSGGAGQFVPVNNPNTTYIPAASEYGTTVTLTFTSNDPAGPCPAVSASTQLTINTLPIVFAGNDIKICPGSTLDMTLLNATITDNGSGVTTGNWTTSGTGTFQPNNAFPGATLYVPSQADYNAGFVILTLTSADPTGPCNAVSDAVRLGFKKSGAPVCNNNVQVSLDSTGIATIEPDMVLEGTYEYEFYDVDVIINGQSIGNQVNCTHIDKTYTVKITDICTGNICWGTIKVEDKLPPKITCNNYNLVCVVENFDPNYIVNTLGVQNGIPTVQENCPPATLTHVDDYTDLDCTQQFSARLRRTWTATDASGNSSSCIQTINFERRGINNVLFPADITLACDANGVNTTPQATGAPYFTAFNQNWQILPTVGACEIQSAFVDQVLPVCDGTYKILRTWTVYDWCLPTKPTAPNQNPQYFIQVIKVDDLTGPALTCPANVTVGTDAVGCCASTDLPDVVVEDACSRVNSATARIVVRDPVTNLVVATYEYNGTIGDFPGNNYWDADTLVAYGLTDCLPLGAHTVTYTVMDACENTRTCTFRLTVDDRTPPVAACDDFTNVSLGVNGEAFVFATTFDDGSYDNCGTVSFKARRMDSNGCQSNGQFHDEVKFCCEDIGDTIMVVFRAYDIVAQTGSVSLTYEEQNSNDCMVRVFVEDKIKPFCKAPAHVTVACEAFDPTLWAYGFATAEDNCCIDTITETRNLSLFDTLCNRGTITRTFRAFDCGGQTNTCTQRVVVNYNQNYYLRFPNDVIVTACNGTGNYGEPAFFGEDCELLAVSHHDEIFTVVPDACFKIERTWTVNNWCTYDPNLGCIDIPNPNPNPSTNHPSNLPGPTISPAGTPAPWTPTVVAILPGQTPTNYSTFWNANANCYRYKQIIKIIDTQKPVIENCPSSPVEVCDVTPNAGDLWNEMYWWDNGTQSHDLCEAPTDLSITATDLCSGSNINIRYQLFLDLDGDGTMETIINSTQTGLGGLGWNNVPFGNAGGGSGTPRQFDERPVPANQKYGFAIQTTTSGTNKTASVRWNTQQAQATYVVPELPYGVHKIKWLVEDGCGNEQTCEYIFEVKDCKKPTVVCINGLSVNIMPTKMITLTDADFLLHTDDNCTPANRLITAIRKAGQGTGFPLNPDNTPQKTVTFTCAELGKQNVEIWSRDLAGNADFCVTYVEVQDNMGNCSTTHASVSGALKTEAGNGLEDASVSVGNMTSSSDASGMYAVGGLPYGNDYTVTPLKDNDPLNGVSTFDLVLINKHILGLEPLNSPYKMISADANNSRSITTFDIVELRKLILGIYTELPNNTSWRFVDKDYQFPNPQNPFQTLFPETKQYAALQSSVLDADFYAMKVGDVNGNAVTSSLVSTEDRTAGTLLFDVQDRTVKAGETFTVTFKAAEKVQGYQFTLNHAGLELVDVKPGANMSLGNFGVFAADQAVTTSWDGDVQAEFALTFRATASGELSRMLGVSGRITKAEAYNAGAERLQVGFRFNGANGQTITGLGFELYQNTPNPFVNKTQIGFHLPEATTATLTIFDETGRMLFTQKGDFAKGYNAVTVDRSVLNATGVLYYTLETAKESATRKMIQTK